MGHQTKNKYQQIFKNDLEKSSTFTKFISNHIDFEQQVIMVSLLSKSKLLFCTHPVDLIVQSFHTAIIR